MLKILIGQPHVILFTCLTEDILDGEGSSGNAPRPNWRSTVDHLGKVPVMNILQKAVEVVLRRESLNRVIG